LRGLGSATKFLQLIYFPLQCIILFLLGKGKQMAVQQLLDNLYLTPAPWRKWIQTREEIIQDWKAGKDFRIQSGPYCSIRDIEYLRNSYNRIYIIHDRGSIEV
jgi:hypothetical protein